MAAVLVREGHADRNVDHAELRIGGKCRPRVVLADAFVADLRPLLPRFRAELTGLRNEVELPHLASSADVEAANEAWNVADAGRIVAVNRRVAEYDDIADHDRRRAVRDLPEFRIDTDGAVGADPFHRIPAFAGTRGAH